MEEDITEKNIYEKDYLMIFSFVALALALVSTISYFIYSIIAGSGIFTIIGVLLLVIFSGLLVAGGFFIENKKAKIFISIAALMLALYSIIQIIVGITTPKDTVPNFTNLDIKEAVTWAKKKDIDIEQEFEYSDDIKEYHIIRQDVKAGTNLKKVKKIIFTVSNGIDPNKLAPVTNMVGWELDDVVKFIDDNHLTNVTINFEFSNTVEKDKIISQDVIKEIKRNEAITLTSSLGKESDLESVTLDNLVGKDTFHALLYLNRNHLKYSIVYTYNVEKAGTVLKQNLKKWTVISKDRKEEVILTIAKEDEITVPDLSKMSKSQITDWATENRIKVEFDEDYDDTVKEGKVITFDTTVGNTIKTGTNIKITLSKGPVKMIEFTDIDSFKEWAKEYGIVYNIEYQFSDTVKQGNLIYASHKKGQIVKNNDTVELVISDGSFTTIPSLIGLNKEDAEKRCKEYNIVCKFEYEDSSDTEFNFVSKQSMKADSVVPTDTTVTVTLGK